HCAWTLKVLYELSQPYLCVLAVESTESWPWQVTISHNGEFRCGGSLITNQWVLTAASCISHNLTEVHLGCHNQSDLSSSKMSRTLEDIICHPEFNNNTHENDICLLKLSVPVTFTDYIQPVCLASAKSTFHSGTSSWITDLCENGKYIKYSLIFLECTVNVPVVGNNECQCYYEGDKVVMENMICAGLSAGEKDSCQGNLGGQLMTMDGFEWLQSGVVTFNDDCARPAVFTRVSQYQNWIKDTVTGTQPNFVTFTSLGPDTDFYFTCPRSSTLPVPTAVTTFLTFLFLILNPLNQS
uniref:Peptidase S1 domain-containing protein n=1 Tax=Neolamprologus brichardi TaxID=32507 RepID=A0A3Q4H3J1_NEOBR